MKKLKAGIIGSGNIGTDLMMKVESSQFLEMSAMIGIDPNSDGLRHAKKRGHSIFDNGIDGFLEESNLADILFDATSAKAHYYHAQSLEKIQKQVIDLTPAAIGPFVVPTVNLEEHVTKSNINMITCGGQATIPIVHAINSVCQVDYAEIVATIASESAGPGTRANIDEFTYTTAQGIEKVGGAKKGKAIIILNPADPPIIMRDTVQCIAPGANERQDELIEAIQKRVRQVQNYVPGYTLRTNPIFDGDQITVFIEVKGAADYLPSYAGNLDIMTASAVKVGEELAKHQLSFSENL
ncbi:acetaldehyde dehydrogenase (acetylating) [Alteribacillus bidgolensis]|uniref:Acetaldehyde dehydrogenase n=1 Tax=Alteribacillus bidgolensis TaxID=930129 RepID=A0A1G8KVR1_9BACI|nr:acetaldehyde dehydrogenase (acetylating) [Alteribacillus bidgolensis]SDI47501.1 acetaldehyde dehydrogenase [Alteribacillus bidgolensis]